jgi:plasmid stability protein
MSKITIFDVDAELEQNLRQLAAAHGRSVEEEVRQILRETVAPSRQEAAPENLGRAIRAIVEPLGGITLDLPARQPIRTPPAFE